MSFPPPNVAGDNSPGEPDDAALDRLGDSLAEIRENQQAASEREEKTAMGRVAGSDAGIGFRIVSELVAGVVVGCVLGYALDQWLDSSPLGFIIFFLLGSAAGILNVIRYVNRRSAASPDDT